MKKLLYIGNFAFPYGEAYSTRAYYFCRIFESLGWNVFVVGLGENRAEDKTSDGYLFEGINYNNIKRPVRKLSSRLYNFYNKSNEIREIVNKILKEDKYQAIFVAVGFHKFIKPLLQISKHENIPIFVDAVEWFEATQLPLGKLGPFYWDMIKGIKKDYIKTGNIICISSFFQNYYTMKGSNTVRIPIILDTQDERWNIENFKPNKNLVLAYAGSPGKKDLLSNIIEGIYINEYYNKIELRLYGISKLKFIKMLGKKAYVLNKLEDCIKFYECIPHTLVGKELQKADFTVLIRHNKRYANAGFPTKVAESLTAGVPIITNLTSDLHLYIKDGQEGIITENSTPQAFCDALNRALKLDVKKLKLMRQTARETALKSFDYRLFVPEIKVFLDNIL
jgi:glycosyltransferase involved in cell wall biosynthesis